MKNKQVRNFCIIAHIDHGKSTLADRFLELTHAVTEREKKEQMLDSMDIERERGITIKMQPVTMQYQGYELNLIDTPGHVDFTYEVSRALAAVEGALLLVDAAQGIQAQTLANLYLAVEQNLVIIPVINKIDLKAAQIEQVTHELRGLLGVEAIEILKISAKTGKGVEDVLQAIVDRIPAPKTKKTDAVSESTSLVFDSYYDRHRGVVCDIRIFKGELKPGDKILFYQTKKFVEVKEVGIYTPQPKSLLKLSEGDIGYVVPGVRAIADAHVGDTIAHISSLKLSEQVRPLPGHKPVKPVVFATMFPKDQAQYADLHQALDELSLNDSAIQFEPASSSALGKGFKIGVLGLLHLDIIAERIMREHGIAVILTVPQVEYHLLLRSQLPKQYSAHALKPPENFQKRVVITSPQEFPEDTAKIDKIFEPWVKLEIITPDQYIGDLMQFIIGRRGEYVNTEYMETGSQHRPLSRRALLHFHLPLSELLTDFYDKLKSISAGFASLNYEFGDWEPVELSKITYLIAGEERETLSMLTEKKDTYDRARHVLTVLKKEIPPTLFEIRIQAKVGGKIIASERIAPLRKDVTAKLYGGDVTRKRKLLEKQKKGKKRLAASGTVEIPGKAYLAVLMR